MIFKECQISKRIVNKIDIDSNKSLSKQSIALNIGGDSWDYPLWVMLKNKFSNKHPYFFHLFKDHTDAIGKDYPWKSK